MARCSVTLLTSRVWLWMSLSSSDRRSDHVRPITIHRQSCLWLSVTLHLYDPSRGEYANSSSADGAYLRIRPAR
jgi:hypothetical protein